METGNAMNYFLFFGSAPDPTRIILTACREEDTREGGFTHAVHSSMSASLEVCDCVSVTQFKPEEKATAHCEDAHCEGAGSCAADACAGHL